jgi:hypothetical protein
MQEIRGNDPVLVMSAVNTQLALLGEEVDHDHFKWQVLGPGLA